MGKNELLKEVEKKKRGPKNGEEKQKSVLHYLATAGAIGWMVVLPTLAGTYFGRWLDRITGERGMWTLSLMLIGLSAGIFWVWYTNRNGDRR